MLINTGYPNLLHSCDFLCLNLMNYQWVWDGSIAIGLVTFSSQWNLIWGFFLATIVIKEFYDSYCHAFDPIWDTTCMDPTGEIGQSWRRTCVLTHNFDLSSFVREASLGPNWASLLLNQQSKTSASPTSFSGFFTSRAVAVESTVWS